MIQWPSMTNEVFIEQVWRYYQDHGRHELPWRQRDSKGAVDPYHVLVSELMLQQTQVNRVIPKFQEFTEVFPTFISLAQAPLSGVLTLWSGLGYNRRAKFLWQSAGIVTNDFNGILPDQRADLVTLPGIGPNTAGAIMAYAYNKPVVFIETNIRTVFIHHFFPEEKEIPDTALVPLILCTLPKGNPREWYWALMDYGTYLKQTVGNVSRASKHFVKQSTFKGSRRQIRGQVIRLLTRRPHSKGELAEIINDQRLVSVLADLCSEGFIAFSDDLYQLRT